MMGEIRSKVGLNICWRLKTIQDKNDLLGRFVSVLKVFTFGKFKGIHLFSISL